MIYDRKLGNPIINYLVVVVALSLGLVGLFFVSNLLRMALAILKWYYEL
jgi:uncharacterized membrane protein YuzA (DUF378 family)